MATGRPPKQPLPDGRYVCTRCVVPKLPSEYYDSAFSWCKQCICDFSRARKVQNRRLRRNKLAYRQLVREHGIERAGNGVLMLQAWATS